MRQTPSKGDLFLFCLVSFYSKTNPTKGEWFLFLFGFPFHQDEHGTGPRIGL